MHDIEPFHKWRDNYIAADDKLSPFFGQQYDEFKYTQKVYNYFIHPQWDEIGSATLYLKILYADYDEGYAIIELIGEWNDCLHNDVMYLKREVVDVLVKQGIYRFILLAEHVFNFHGSDDSYYEEWYEDVRDDDGWICVLNALQHVEEEMHDTRLQYYVHFGGDFADVNWRIMKPKALLKLLEGLVHGGTKRIAG